MAGSRGEVNISTSSSTARLHVAVPCGGGWYLILLGCTHSLTILPPVNDIRPVSISLPDPYLLQLFSKLVLLSLGRLMTADCSASLVIKFLGSVQ